MTETETETETDRQKNRERQRETERERQVERKQRGGGGQTERESARAREGERDAHVAAGADPGVSCIEGAELLAHAEVGQLELAPRIDQHIGWLDVAVD